MLSFFKDEEDIMSIDGKDLYYLAKEKRLVYSQKDKNGIPLYEEFANYFDPNEILFSFIGFHNYKSVWKHDGYAVYGFIETSLLIYTKKGNFHYRVDEFIDVSWEKKTLGNLLTFVFESTSFVVDTGAGKAETEVIIDFVMSWKNFKTIKRESESSTLLTVSATTYYANPELEGLFERQKELEAKLKVLRDEEFRLQKELEVINHKITGL